MTTSCCRENRRRLWKKFSFVLVNQKSTGLGNLYIYENRVGKEVFFPWAPKPNINHKMETVGWTRIKMSSKWILISLLAVLCNVQYEVKSQKLLTFQLSYSVKHTQRKCEKCSVLRATNQLLFSWMFAVP